MLERVCLAVTDNGSKFHKYFEPEYKKEIVRLVEELGRSPSEVASDIGVSVTTIRRWVQAYGTKGEAAFPGKGKRYPVDEELRKRDRRIKELEEENAILKKAMAIFAKDGK